MAGGRNDIEGFPDCYENEKPEVFDLLVAEWGDRDCIGMCLTCPLRILK